MFTSIYQVPVEVYNQFVKFLGVFKIKYNIERDNSEPHTYGLIKVEAENEIQDDIETVLNKLIAYANGR